LVKNPATNSAMKYTALITEAQRSRRVSVCRSMRDAHFD
jgi:hypothetical protein